MTKSNTTFKDLNDYTDDWVFDEILTDNSDTEEDFVMYKSIKGKRCEDKCSENNDINILSEKESQYLSSLLQYQWFLSNTDSTIQYINELFEYNMTSADELREYYLQRPHLFEYTFNT